MSWQSKSAAVAIAIMAMSLHSSSVQAMPEQGKVVAGQGEIVRPDDKTMVINQKTDRLALDWQKFNIAKDEKVHFDQNSKSAIAINRVVGDGRSIIDGSLSATGNVFVINPNGVLFGKNSSVDVGGLVASTANVTDEDMRNFTQGKGDLGLQIAAGREASVINAGTIKAEGGLVALHATTVENTGTIANEGGQTVLAAAKNLNLAADTAGKLNFTVNGSLANAKALNSGTLQNDGGYLVMTAKSAGDLMSTVVNNTGVIEAKTLHANDKGEILLDGGENGQVEVSGTLDASGKEAGQSAGSIKVIGQKTVVNDGTNLLARGAIDGGKIETSGDVLNLGNNLNIDAKGERGKAGEWLLDPLDVIISVDDPTKSYDPSITAIKKYTDVTIHGGLISNDITYNDPDATSANAAASNIAVTWIKPEQITKILNTGTNVTLQAAAAKGAANIIVSDEITKTAGGEATLTLDAMRNITINKAITSDENTGGILNVVLNADTDSDKVGAVIINADIKTNGGYFISATGGEKDNAVKFTGNSSKGYGNGNVSGKPDIHGSTVGTYFGTVNNEGIANGEKGDRLIQTKGGSITLNGEVAIGLNGGTLTLDTANANGNKNKGAVTVTGIINSGNSYGTHIYGTSTWNSITIEKVSSYLDDGYVPAYHYQFVNYKKDNDGKYVLDFTVKDGKITYNTQEIKGPHYSKDYSSLDTQNLRFRADGTNTGLKDTMISGKGEGYASVIVTKGKMTFAQWLQYEMADSKVEFAQKYIPQSEGLKLIDSKDNKGNPMQVVAHANGTPVTDNEFANYLAKAQSSLTKESINNDETVMFNGNTAKENMKDDIRRLLASNWFESKELAAQGSKGRGDLVEDSYLATITTVLENSLTTPNGQQIMWAGGMGSGNLGKTGDTQNPYANYGQPNDPNHVDGMYWVTGPEGLANDGKGTQFFSNKDSKWPSQMGKNIYGFVNWSTWTDGGKPVSQPDNSSPFLSVGYGTTGMWDDAAMGGATTVGFVKETNLANSNLVINAGGGTVNLKGDIGKAKALDTLKITSDAAVQIGDTSNDATKYHNGTVYVDHGLYIDGAGVKVGGEIHSGESEETDTSTTLEDKYKDNVTILSSGNIEVHGITSNTYDVLNDDGIKKTTRGGKISLTSTGDKGNITLGAGVDYNGKATDGTLAAASAEQGAVVVDAQGSQGALVNNTKGTNAITTGKDVTTGKYGTWQVYVASPSDYGTVLGDNLNSETNAQWSSESTKKSTSAESDKNAADRDIGTYTDHTHNKFIFQVTPTITVSGQDMTKTYGDTLSPEDLRNKLTITSATFKASDNTSAHSVDEYSKNFQEESDKSKYIASKSDATSTGMKNIFVSSIAQDPTATRTGGYKESSTDNKKAIYPFSVGKENAAGLNGYALDTKNADIEIIKRKANITGTGTQTYGGEKGKFDWTETKKENIAPGSNVFYTTSVKSDSAYTEKQQNRNTADYGTYGDSVSFDNLKITDSKRNEVNIADNYDLTTTGTIEVGKATLTVKINDASTQYGTPFDEESGKNKKSYDYTVVSGNANGETEVEVKGLLGKLKNYKNAGVGDNGRATQDVGSYGITGEQNTPLTNYTVKIEKGTATIAPRDVYFHVTGNGKTIGDVVYTVTDTNPNPDYPLNPNDPINSQLAYRETVTPSYRPDGRLPNGHYGVSTSLPGYGPIESGKVYGNYRYHYDGDVTLTTPSKPDIVPPVNPPVMPGTGTVTPLPETPENTSNTPENTTETTDHKTVWDGERDRGGDRPEDKRVVTLPFFKVLEDKTTHRYGTYDVAKRTTEVKIEPSAQVLPEPNQPATQYRELTTELTTDKGTGEFTLKYNGSRFTILPDDDAAMKLIVVGDETKNRALFEKALHVAFTQMGLEVADLDGVYIHFGKD